MTAGMNPTIFWLMVVGCADESLATPLRPDLVRSLSGAPVTPTVREDGETNPALGEPNAHAIPAECARDDEVRLLAVAPVKVIDKATAVDFDVLVSSVADVAVACTADDDPLETHLVEGSDLSEGSLRLHGLRADSLYHCAATTTCPVAAGPAHRFDLRTDPLPADVPATSVERDPSIPLAGGAYTIFNHQLFCSEGANNQLVIVDPEGRVRWYHPLPEGLDAGVEALPGPDGTIVWGGGGTSDGAPAVLTLDGDTIERVAYEGSEEELFHHDGKRLADGRYLTLSMESNSADGVSWLGFGIGRYDPNLGELDWAWNSQAAADQGALPSGQDDPWHANWVDMAVLDGRDTALVSLCNLSQIAAVDVATNQVDWTWGAGGDFTLTDPTGQTLPDTEWPQCIHGPEVSDGRILVLDNGRFRQESRVARYLVDRANRRAVLEWTWTDGWYQGHLGDVDELPGGHVLVDQASFECFGDDPEDRSRIVEVDYDGNVLWRLQLDDQGATSYRAHRVPSCGFFSDARYCPDVASRLAELAPLLSE